MPRTRLNEALSELHRELGSDTPIDGADRAHLQALLVEIQKTLDSGSKADHEIVGGSVQETIARFEVSHPTITAGLQQIIDSLRRL